MSPGHTQEEENDLLAVEHLGDELLHEVHAAQRQLVDVVLVAQGRAPRPLRADGARPEHRPAVVLLPPVAVLRVRALVAALRRLRVAAVGVVEDLLGVGATTGRLERRHGQGLAGGRGNGQEVGRRLLGREERPRPGARHPRDAGQEVGPQGGRIHTRRREHRLAGHWWVGVLVSEVVVEERVLVRDTFIHVGRVRGDVGGSSSEL